MKKILCFILTMLMLVSVGSVSAVQSEDTELSQKFYDYCVEVLPEDMQPDADDAVKIFSSVKTEKGTEVFVAYCSWINNEEKEVYKVVDNYHLYTHYSTKPYDLGIYVCSGEQIYTLERAFELNFIDDLSVLERIEMGYFTYVFVEEEAKYANEILPDFIKRYSWDNNMNANYYEGYEYYSPENTSTPDFVVFSLHTNLFNNMESYDLFGNYVMRESGGSIPYAYGKAIYVPEEKKIYSISEAYKLNLEGIDKIFTEGELGELIGDMDKDRKLTVKDATYIQKCLADMIEFPPDDRIAEFINAYISDFNRDGVRNIKDATAIQKYIAGLEY